jgi:hypothetical protein
MTINLHQFKTDDLPKIWESIKTFYELTETYRTENVIVARDENDNSATFDLMAKAIETTLFEAEALKLLLGNQDDDHPFIGKCFTLAEVKTIAPKKYVIVTPKGGDVYYVNDIVGFHSALNTVDDGHYNGTMFSKIVISGETIYNTILGLGSAGGGCLMHWEGISHPFNYAVQLFDKAATAYLANDMDVCVRNIAYLTREILTKFYGYENNAVSNYESYIERGKIEPYSDEIKPFGDIYSQTQELRHSNKELSVSHETLKSWLLLLRNWLVEQINKMEILPLPSYLPPNTSLPVLDMSLLNIEL